MPTTRKRFRLFGLTTAVLGEGVEADHLAAVLGAVARGAPPAADDAERIVFDFTRQPAPPGPDVKAGEVRFGPSYVEYLSPTHRVLMERAGATIRIGLTSARKAPTGLRLREIYRTALTYGSLDPDEARRSRLLSYATLWGPYAIALLACGKALFHAGCIEVGGRGFLVVGAGGAGKSSVTLSLVAAGKARYLSEDYCVADEGQAYLSPRPLPIYSEDLARGNPVFVRWWDRTFGRVERALWRRGIAARRNPRRMAPPMQVFGEAQVAATAPICGAAILMRGSFERIQVRPVPLEEFVDRALGVVFRELFNMRDLLFYGDYLRTKDGFDVSYIGCSATLRELYAKILRGRPLFMAEAPLKAAPADIAGAIMDAFGAQ
jgi:hypothetical protein